MAMTLAWISCVEIQAITIGMTPFMIVIPQIFCEAKKGAEYGQAESADRVH
jgi:hypothetical protein